MKTRSTAMAEESQQLAQLQGQVTSLQAEMATWAEIQSTHEALDRLTQMVQLLMNDCPKIPKKNLSKTLKPTLKSTPQTDIPSRIPSQTLITRPGEVGTSKSSHPGEGLKPKTVRLEFPRFKWEDPETWCCRAKQFFEMYCTLDTQRLPISAFPQGWKSPGVVTGAQGQQ